MLYFALILILMYKHLFGPVPSRRLGMSLGVDLVPHKVCSFNCIYCECGATTRLTTHRAEYVPYADVVRELAHYFEHHPDPEYITFSGAGEPTLHSDLGKVLDFAKKLRPGVPVAVLTNGSLFNDPEVREELSRADVVLPSLDAATGTAFKRINRPAAGLSVEEYIRGLAAFRKEFHGEIWLEVFILPGFNDDQENLLSLRKAIPAIQPDRIQLNTLDRPGVISGLRAATRDELEKISASLSPWNVEIVAPAGERHRIAAYRSDTESAILETISRRPCTADDIAKILGIHMNEVNKYLGVLEKDGKIETTRQERGTFYRIRKS